VRWSEGSRGGRSGKSLACPWARFLLWAHRAVRSYVTAAGRASAELDADEPALVEAGTGAGAVAEQCPQESWSASGRQATQRRLDPSAASSADGCGVLGIFGLENDEV
jgi:hypothetical protein